MECSQRGLLVQSQGSPPLIDRLFDHSVDHSRAVETFRSAAMGPTPEWACRTLCLHAAYPLLSPRPRAL